MSERWGSCRSCRGQGKIKESGRDGLTNELHTLTRECGSCGGTGHSGDIQDYLQKELEREPEQR